MLPAIHLASFVVLCGLGIARYAPAGMLVDESLNILQFRGQVAP
jgi:hypothetical protein